MTKRRKKEAAPEREAPEPALTKTQQANQDISALLRARNSLLWVTTPEEVRVERAIVEAAGSADYETVTWDCDLGLCAADGKAIDRSIQDPGSILDFIRDHRERRVYVLRDFHSFLGNPLILRALRNRERLLKSVPRTEARAMIVLTPSSEIPPDLEGDAVVLDYPLPERREVAAILDDVVSALPADVAKDAAPNGVKEKAIDAALGLTTEGVSRCFARSLVTERRIDPVLVANEKKRVINAVPGVEWFDPDPRGLAGVAGLDLLKPWLEQRREGFSQRAREFGLPAPKGVLLVGVPGCGKSLTAKCVATAWQMPLLRLDLGSTQSKWIGESQANIRKALSVAETVSPCVVWLDELEKALAGATGGAAGDSGVAADALGTILSWMQDRSGNVFVVATANDVTNLPPELLRKGRFDDLFWVDLPTHGEREAIAAVTLRKHRRDPEQIDCTKVANATDGFSGAEIAALVPDALFAAFSDGEREITTADLVSAAKDVVPLSKTAADKIERLREWAKGRARPASTPEVQGEQTGARALDL